MRNYLSLKRKGLFIIEKDLKDLDSVDTVRLVGRLYVARSLLESVYHNRKWQPLKTNEAAS